MTPMDALVALALLQAQAQLPSPPPPPPPIVVAAAPQRPRRMSTIVVFSSGFDSNVNRDIEDLNAVGMTVGAGVAFVNNPRKPTLELAYQAGLHRYTGTDRWNRVSHFARAAWERSLSRDWVFDLASEMSIKGSTEDRELGNQVAVSPRVEYKLDSALRIRGVAAYRLRRYPTDPGRDATNRYVGLELAGRPRRGLRWETGARVEDNVARDPRRTYHRYTVYGGWAQSIGRRDRVETELKLRLQHYPDRLVDISGGPDAPRKDRRWEPEVSWVHQSLHGELRATYSYERRTSNDPFRGYNAHVVMFAVAARR